MNNLLETLHGEGKPQFQINEIQDHLAKIEMKVQQLETDVPCHIQRTGRLLVASAGVDEYEAGDESMRSSKRNTKNSIQSTATKKGYYNDTAQNRNCFARVLFSKCWAGSRDRNNRAGWNLQCCNKSNKIKRGACPAYTTCPCGDDAPCAKIERKPCPANKGGGGSKGGNKAGRNKSECGTDNIGDGKRSKGQGKGSKGKCEKPSKDDGGLSGLCGKVCNAPCIFSRKKGGNDEGKSSWRCLSCNLKRHVHTPCCCRCKDNPELPNQKKSVKGKPGEKQRKKDEKGTKESGKSYSYDDDYDDYEDAEAFLAIAAPKKEGVDPTQEPMRCVACTDCDDTRANNQALMLKDGSAKPKRKTPLESATEKVPNDGGINSTKIPTLEKLVDINIKNMKSHTHKSNNNLQLLVQPSITDLSANNLVSHRILKTLSTIHGPIRVEQKIVMDGRQNAMVIVTHGESCECNLCSTLKSGNNTEKVGHRSTGSDMFVNHSDDCRCALCSIVERGITEETPVKDLEGNMPPHVFQARWSASNVVGSDAKICDLESHGFYCDILKMNNIEDCSKCDETIHYKKHKNGSKDDKRDKKKCHCFKCQRRRTKRLKRQLNSELGLREYLQVFHEFSEQSIEKTGCSKKVNEDECSGDDDELAVVPTSCNKRVSFSKAPNKMISDCDVDALATKNVEFPYDIEQNDGLYQQFENGSKVHKDHTMEEPKGEETALISIKAVKPRKKRLPNDPCDCLVCNQIKPSVREGISKVTVLSTVSDHEQNENEQSRSPRRSESKSSRDSESDGEISLTERVINEITHPEDEYIRPAIRCEATCTGRCRHLTPRDELSRSEASSQPFVMNASHERMSSKVMYWEPSNADLATTISSDSYYIPDEDSTNGTVKFGRNPSIYNVSLQRTSSSTSLKQYSSEKLMSFKKISD